jgi:hypothetical protein
MRLHIIKVGNSFRRMANFQKDCSSFILNKHLNVISNFLSFYRRNIKHHYTGQWYEDHTYYELNNGDKTLFCSSIQKQQEEQQQKRFKKNTNNNNHPTGPYTSHLWSHSDKTFRQTSLHSQTCRRICCYRILNVHSSIWTIPCLYSRIL